MVGGAPVDEFMIEPIMTTTAQTPPPPFFNTGGRIMSNTNDFPKLLDTVIDPKTIYQTCKDPSFFVVTRSEPDVTFNGVSPFKLNNYIIKDIGHVQVKKLRDGSLLIETQSKEQATSLMSLKILGNLPIIVKPHTTLNTSKGIIYSRDLLNFSDEELLKEFESQNIINVKRIMTRKDKELVPSPMIALTFGSTILPEYIFAGYVRIPVRLNIPNPFRCLNCQKLGHTHHRCEAAYACDRCGTQNKHAGPCDGEPCCINCKGNHPSWSRECPSWKREKKILEIQTKEKIPAHEARRKFFQLYPNFSKPHVSYAQSIGTATPTNAPKTTDKSEMENVMKMMELLLAGQNEMKAKIEEQTKQINELRKENEILKQENIKMKSQLKPIKPPTKVDVVKPTAPKNPKTPVMAPGEASRKLNRSASNLSSEDLRAAKIKRTIVSGGSNDVEMDTSETNPALTAVGTTIEEKKQTT